MLVGTVSPFMQHLAWERGSEQTRMPHPTPDTQISPSVAEAMKPLQRMVGLCHGSWKDHDGRRSWENKAQPIG